MAIARVIPLVLTVLLLGAAPARSQAILLFNNGNANFLGGYEMTESTVADDFQLTVSAQATRGIFSMGDATCTFPANWDGHLRWWIYDDDGGVPGAYVATGFAPEVSILSSFDNCPDSKWYTVQFKLGQIVPLSSGVRYWLALHMAADWTVRRDLEWGTTLPGNYSPGVSSLSGTGPWATVGFELSFSLSFVSTDKYLFVDSFESGDTSIWSAGVP